MAARQQGEVTGATAADDPTADLDALREAGIDLDDVTDKLLRDGIDAFMVPMAKLLDGIERKREAIVTHRPAAIEADLPPELEQPLAARVKRAARRGRRAPDLAARRHAVGARGHARGHRPPRLADDRRQAARGGRRARRVRRRVQGRRADRRGAARHGRLEPRARGLPPLLRAAGRRAAPARARLDRAAAGRGRRARDRRLRKTLFLVSTKSGGTIETISLFKHFHGLQADGSHFVLVTDPGSTLLDLAEEHGFRRAFQNDPEIGGRYSALSYFGLVPAALAGIDVRPLLEGAQVAEQACSDFENPEHNAGLWLGLALGELARAGRDKLTFVVDDPIASFGVWVEQLVAESTGKEGRGILPVADEPLLAADAYGPDRVFLHLRNTDAPDARHDRAHRRARQGGPPDDHRAGARARRPRARVLPRRVRDRGRRLGARDQPVRPAQRAAGQGRDEEGARRGRARRSRTATSAELLDGLEPPGYLAIMGYLPYSDEIEAAVAPPARGGDREAPRRHHLRLRPALPALDRPVPQGRPRRSGASSSSCTTPTTTPRSPATTFDFRTLISAQADGDLQTLRDHGLPAVRVRLNSGDLPGSIDALREGL